MGNENERERLEDCRDVYVNNHMRAAWATLHENRELALSAIISASDENNFKLDKALIDLIVLPESKNPLESIKGVLNSIIDEHLDVMALNSWNSAPE